MSIKTKKQLLRRFKARSHRLIGLALVACTIIGGVSYYAVAQALSANPDPGKSSAATKTQLKSSQSKANTVQTSNQAAAAAGPTAAATQQQAPAPASRTGKPVATATPNKVTNVSRGSALYVPADQAATINAAAAAAPASDAAVLSRLASQSTAHWFGGWNSDTRGDVNRYVSAARAVNQVPVMVAYNIPGRDCGGESAGGAANAASYATWIRQFAAGVANRQAIVVLEPDAVAADCFSDARAAMLSDAVNVLQGNGASVYIDAGNPTWQSSREMVHRLTAANIAAASGFSLNVSNFQTTAANISYGTSVSNLIGGKHFVIDTSRNGNGPTADAAWCNPAGRALGQTPTTSTGYRLVDAFLWIKVPGESDGRCGPAIGSSQPPVAGTYWPEYALMLARNAGW